MNRLLLIIMTALLIAGCDRDRTAHPGNPEDEAETLGPREGQGGEGETAEEGGQPSQEEIEKAQAVVTLIERARDADDVEEQSPTEPGSPTTSDSVAFDPTRFDPTVICDPLPPPQPAEAAKEIVLPANPPKEDEPKVEAAKESRVEAKPTPPPVPTPDPAFYARHYRDI